MPISLRRSSGAKRDLVAAPAKAPAAASRTYSFMATMTEIRWLQFCFAVSSASACPFDCLQHLLRQMISNFLLFLHSEENSFSSLQVMVFLRSFEDVFHPDSHSKNANTSFGRMTGKGSQGTLRFHRAEPPGRPKQTSC